ncbi:hypothetical protein D3C72_2554330 [compost metagenome]
MIRSWIICRRGVNSANSSVTGQQIQMVIQNTSACSTAIQPSSGWPRVGVSTISIICMPTVARRGEPSVAA